MSRSDWETTATSLGYLGEKEMLEDLYLTRKFSLAIIARKLGTSSAVVASHINKAGITLRKRGGANYVKVIPTPELEERVRVEGVQQVADALGVDYSTLYKVFYRSKNKTRRGEKKEAESLTPHPPPESPESA